MKYIRFSNKKKPELFYNLFIFILVFLYLLESTSLKQFNGSIIHSCLQFVALLFAIIYICLKKYSTKNLIQILILNTVGILCYISSGYSGLFLMMLAVSLLPEGYMDRLLKNILFEEFILFSLIAIASILGIIQNLEIDINKGSYITRAFSLGFGHPNMLAAQATSIIFLFICVNRYQLRRSHIALSLLFILVIFFVSQSRTALILGVMTLLLVSINYINIKFDKYLFPILPWIYIFIISIVFINIFLYYKLGHNSDIVKVINDGIFNGRIGLASRSLGVFPITLFGKAFDMNLWPNGQYFALDNGQVMLVLNYGIIGFLLYFGVVQKILLKVKNNRETILAIVVIAFLIWTMYEGTMYFIGKNFMFFFLGLNKKRSRA